MGADFKCLHYRKFLAKPMMGMINSDYQIVVFQLMKTSHKESLYAERWNVVFDGFKNNSVRYFDK